MTDWVHALTWSMRDAVHPSRIMIIRIVFYKDRFDVYVTNAGNIAIRMDVSGQDLRKDASCRHSVPTIVGFHNIYKRWKRNAAFILFFY
jgi:hypothetical protein